MRQQAFEQQHAALWDELSALLDDLEGPRRRRRLDPEALDRLPWLYRRACNHYALACGRMYSPGLVAQLHDLVLRGHRQLYRRNGAWLGRSLHFVAAGFPRAVRRNARYFWLAALLFVLPGLLVGGFCYAKPELIYSILDQDQVAAMEYMYDPANRRPGRSEARSSEKDFVMFGVYISNNIGIGFRTFAGGVLFGVGTVFFLVLNGLVIGGVAGHLTRIGYEETFWSFVSGHGAFELTAIAVSGAAGLMLGHALLAPGQLDRGQALKRNAAEAVQLVMGAAAMLVVAAFIEAFWSSSGVSNGLKYGAAAGLWLLVAAYIGLGGRGQDGPG